VTASRMQPLPLDAWPLADRTAWRRATTAAGLFDDAGHAASLQPATITNYQRAYGHWLAFLTATGDLVSDHRPGARVTPNRLDGWQAFMQSCDCRNGTVRLYLTCLHAILRLLDPETPVHGILKPGGVRLAAWLPSEPKPFPALDTEDVMAKVFALHRAGLARRNTRKGQLELRDAALIGLLFRRAPRVGSLAVMRLGVHLLPAADDGLLVSFPAEDTKTGRALAWPLDRDCVTLLQDYLRSSRPHFPVVAGTDHVWLGIHRTPLNEVGIAALMHRRAKAWFGEGFGPHTARKCVRATAARRSPETAFDAAEVLGHSPRTSLLHYADAIEVGACARHVDGLAALRRQTAGLADRLTARRLIDRTQTVAAEEM